MTDIYLSFSESTQQLPRHGSKIASDTINEELKPCKGHQMKIGYYVLFLMTACNAAQQQPEQHGTELNYAKMSDPNSCSIKYAFEPEFRVCFTNTPSKNIEDYTIRGIHEYLNVARTLSSDVTKKVVKSCLNPHLTVNVRQGSGTSTAGPRRINTYSSKGYGTILHELGHAFACLGDTYVSGKAGRCQPGQPESIMCWGNYGKHELYADDIAGIKAMFKQVHPRARQEGKPQNQNSTQSDSPSSLQKVLLEGSVDDDRDGIHNHEDLCSNTPKNAVVWTYGEWKGCSYGQRRDG